MGHRCQEDECSVFFETERVQSSLAEKGQHTEEERKDETTRDSDHERQSHAGSLSDGFGTHYGDNSGRQLLWIQEVQKHGGCY